MPKPSQARDKGGGEREQKERINKLTAQWNRAKERDGRGGPFAQAEEPVIAALAQAIVVNPRNPQVFLSLNDRNLKALNTLAETFGGTVQQGRQQGKNGWIWQEFRVVDLQNYQGAAPAEGIRQRERPREQSKDPLEVLGERLLGIFAGNIQEVSEYLLFVRGIVAGVRSGLPLLRYSFIDRGRDSEFHTRRLYNVLSEMQNALPQGNRGGNIEIALSTATVQWNNFPQEAVLTILRNLTSGEGPLARAVRRQETMNVVTALQQFVSGLEGRELRTIRNSVVQVETGREAIAVGQFLQTVSVELEQPAIQAGYTEEQRDIHLQQLARVGEEIRRQVVQTLDQRAEEARETLGVQISSWGNRRAAFNQAITQGNYQLAQTTALGMLDELSLEQQKSQVQQRQFDIQRSGFLRRREVDEILQQIERAIQTWQGSSLEAVNLQPDLVQQLMRGEIQVNAFPLEAVTTSVLDTLYTQHRYELGNQLLTHVIGRLDTAISERRSRIQTSLNNLRLITTVSQLPEHSGLQTAADTLSSEIQRLGKVLENERYSDLLTHLNTHVLRSPELAQMRDAYQAAQTRFNQELEAANQLLRESDEDLLPSQRARFQAAVKPESYQVIEALRTNQLAGVQRAIEERRDENRQLRTALADVDDRVLSYLVFSSTYIIVETTEGRTIKRLPARFWQQMGYQSVSLTKEGLEFIQWLETERWKLK